jgi:cold shock CspA family protein
MTSSIGCVKCFSPVKGYGFLIDVDTKEELFVHYSALRKSHGFKTLWQGEYVEYTRDASEQGPVAKNITGIRGGPLMCDSRQ